MLEPPFGRCLLANRLRLRQLQRGRARPVERQVRPRNLEPPGERHDRRARVEHDVADVLRGDALCGGQKRGGEETRA